MLIKTRVLDEMWNPVFQGQTEVDAQNLMRAAESREAIVRIKGADWAIGAIPFFGHQLVRAMKSGQRGDAVDKAAVNVALAAWLSDSVHSELGAETFMQYDLEFTISHEGVVKYDRLPGSID